MSVRRQAILECIYTLMLQILCLKTTAMNGECEKAGDSRAYIYASRVEGEGARERILYASHAQSEKMAQKLLRTASVIM